MARKNVAIGVRLTSLVRERVRSFVTVNRSEHATILALLELGLREAEADPSLLGLERPRPVESPPKKSFLDYLVEGSFWSKLRPQVKGPFIRG
jgi:hypothetical protein